MIVSGSTWTRRSARTGSSSCVRRTRLRRRERLRPCRGEDKRVRGEASASERAGGGAPAPVKKSWLLMNTISRRELLLTLPALALVPRAFAQAKPQIRLKGFNHFKLLVPDVKRSV